LRGMKVSIATLPNGEFDVDEVSAAFCRLRAIHALGSGVEMADSDYERLMSEAKAAAQKMESEIVERSLNENTQQLGSRAALIVGVKSRGCPAQNVSAERTAEDDCPMTLRLWGVPVFRCRLRRSFWRDSVRLSRG
jgi:hypothetical protein